MVGWGVKLEKTVPYSEQALAKFAGVIDMARAAFKEKNKVAIEQRNELMVGYRFNNDDKILRLLEDNLTESNFMADTESALDRALESAAYGDYYYTYEKQW